MELIFSIIFNVPKQPRVHQVQFRTQPKKQKFIRDLIKQQQPKIKNIISISMIKNTNEEKHSIFTF